MVVPGKLYSFESTVINRSAKVFPWANLRTAKGTAENPHTARPRRIAAGIRRHRQG